MQKSLAAIPLNQRAFPVAKHPGRRLAFSLIAALTTSVYAASVSAGSALLDDAPAVPTAWRLANENLELKFRLDGHHFAASQLLNKLSGRTIPIAQDGFSIGIEGRAALRAADFVFQDARQSAFAGGVRLTVSSTNAEPGVFMQMIYELGDHDAFIRRRMELQPTRPLALREVDMWRVGFAGQCSFQEQGVPLYLQLGPEWKYTAKHQGFGFPVFMDDTFWGLEYPAGYNHYENGLITLRHFPGRMVADRFISKTAVLGVAEAGQVPTRFRQYLDSVIGVRTTPPLFFAWKTWVTVNTPNEANCLALIDQFRRELFTATGARLDSFALDDGWDRKPSLWEIEKGAFPRGFEPLQAALRPMKTGLGLWISPCSGYDHAGWLAANKGYLKNAWDWLLCMSDPNYRRDMTEAVTSLIKKHNVNYVKFDAFCAPCDSPGHAHHLLDNFAKEANTDAYLELQAALRRAQPGIFINITTGTWLSPWWLQHADAVWDEVYDGWSPAIAPTPERTYSQITDRDAVFRKRCRENPWFPIEAVENLGIWTQNYEYIDEQIMTILARGCRLISFYVPIPQGAHAQRDWQFYGSAINWARHHAETLVHTRLILGDPLRLEPYGYAHFLDGRGILVLRNPFVQPRKVRVKLEAATGWERSGPGQDGRQPLVAQIVYPYHQTLPFLLHYGDELPVELSAYEMLVLELAPLDKASPVVLGPRAQEMERLGGRVSYAVHGQPGEAHQVTIPGVAPRAAQWNGRPIPVQNTPEGCRLSLTSEAARQACQAAEARLGIQTKDQIRKSFGRCVVTVPEGIKASMHLVWANPQFAQPPPARFTDTAHGFRLIDDAAEKAVLQKQAERLRAVKPVCTARINGQPVKVKVSDSKLFHPENVGDHRMYAEFPPAPWVWFQFDLPPGTNEVRLAVECPQSEAPEARAGLGWWLWAENPLPAGKLDLAYDTPLPAATPRPWPMPLRQDRQREIITLQPLAGFSPRD